MARKYDVLGHIAKGIDRSIRESIRENERQERLYEKERAKHNKLVSKKNALLKALNINWEMKGTTFKLISLNNNYNVDNATKNILNNIENLDIILDELKYGHRVEAIDELLAMDFSYDKAIDIVRAIEKDLLYYLRKQNNCYEDKEVALYEFASQDEIFELDSNVDFETSKAEVFVHCLPIETGDFVTGKDPNVLTNKIIKSLTKLNEKYIKELYKFQEYRENLILEGLRNEYANILEYDNTNYFRYEDLLDTTKFSSNLEVIDKPQPIILKDTKSHADRLEYESNNKPQREDIEIPILYRILSYTPLKNITNNYIDKNLKKAELQWKSNIQTIEQEIKDIKQYNIIAQQKHDEQIAKYNIYLEDVKKEKQAFLQQQEEHNKNVYLKINKFNNEEKNEVIEYFLNNLKLSPYPFLIYKDIELDYNKDNKLLIINYTLPKVEDITNIKNISLLISKMDFKVTYLKETELNKIYNDILYKICLRTISEVFKNDYFGDDDDEDAETNLVDSVIFNGIIKHLNDIDGQEKYSCIMTLQANKESFAKIDISNINAKNCFKALKGIAAPELASLIPVKPILMINKEDSRFIDAYSVAEHLDDGYNIATMHWKDFENLVRELFEKEFCNEGSEVRITQSSHDGGVDAVIFDPDPIRGGKIVIQAKRYTNIVGVSNVRDLYGTVLNEGAIKGILVTTSDYGVESYDFAKDKPITLLNGNNLLHLLEKQGKKATINLQEAKEFLKNNE